ncbi:MAG: ATP-binding cassette domain-containing protein [Rhizobiaceae bacterium]|nr:ATP-binding cassette domain-containing protein [Rhizobiaceae bacterium]
MTDLQPVLEFRNVTKRFGSLTANDAISLSLHAGEILALLGENGAGKTTLMNILFGHYRADEGAALVDGQELPPGSTQAAIQAGIGMVHQHFTLADNLTVLENITLGTESLYAWRQDQKKARAKLVAMSEDYGLLVDPDVLVSSLSVGERQRVEILKALYRDARILILDEPTAVLTPQESDNLFATLKAITKKGLAIIFISHKLHEILAISSRIAVLRRGAIVGSLETAVARREQLAELMVGVAVARPKLTAIAKGEPVLEISGLSTDGAGASTLKDVNLTIRAHEIVGIAGVAGNGQSTLADLLSGLTQRYAGSVRLNNSALPTGDPRAVVAAGVGRIPEDRHARGMVGEMEIWENLISEDLRSPDISNSGIIINSSKSKSRAVRQIEEFDVRCSGPEAETKLLSGGNMQKLILARALSRKPTLILANQPVRGLDEGAIAYVQNQLLQARQRGAAILLISEDLDELMSLTDRIAVMFHGQLSDAIPTGDRTIAEIGLMMAGQGSVTPGEERSLDH